MHSCWSCESKRELFSKQTNVRCSVADVQQISLLHEFATSMFQNFQGHIFASCCVGMEPGGGLMFSVMKTRLMRCHFPDLKNCQSFLLRSKTIGGSSKSCDSIRHNNSKLNGNSFFIFCYKNSEFNSFPLPIWDLNIHLTSKTKLKTFVVEL